MNWMAIAGMAKGGGGGGLGGIMGGGKDKEQPRAPQMNFGPLPAAPDMSGLWQASNAMGPVPPIAPYQPIPQPMPQVMQQPVPQPMQQPVVVPQQDEDTGGLFRSIYGY